MVMNCTEASKQSYFKEIPGAVVFEETCIDSYNHLRLNHQGQILITVITDKKHPDPVKLIKSHDHIYWEDNNSNGIN